MKNPKQPLSVIEVTFVRNLLEQGLDRSLSELADTLDATDPQLEPQVWTLLTERMTLRQIIACAGPALRATAERKAAAPKKKAKKAPAKVKPAKPKTATAKKAKARRNPKPANHPQKAAKTPPPKTAQGLANGRSKTRELDDRVLKFLKDSPDAQAPDILKKLGCSKAQLRGSIERLREARQVKRDGTTRHATYALR